MGTINIYNDENNTTYQVFVDLVSGYLSPEDLGGTANGEFDIWLRISTNIPKDNISSYGQYVVRDLTDVAPGASSPADDFNALIQGYIDYFMSDAGMAMSSSSSSTSSGSSNSSSSNSSSSNSSTSSLSTSSSSLLG